MGQGWRIFRQDIQAFIGFLIILILINVVLGLVPGVGQIVNLIVYPVLNAGFLIYSFKIIRQQKRQFEDFFAGFSQFGEIILFSIISTILATLPIVPGLVMIFFGIIQLFANGSTPNSSDLINWQEPFSSLLGAGTLVLLLGLIPSTYLNTSYALALPLIIDRRAQFWPAMEMSRKLVDKHWFGMFLFLGCLGCLNFLAVICFLVGLLITIPVSMCAIAAVYADIVGMAPKLDQPSQRF